MRKRDFKGRCEKRRLPKFNEVCKTYDKMQSVMAFSLSEQDEFVELYCNVGLEGVLDDAYMSDLVGVREDGSKVVYECVYKKHLLKPMTMKLLDVSRSYWLSKGVDENDWILVVGKEKDDEECFDE